MFRWPTVLLTALLAWTGACCHAQTAADPLPPSVPTGQPGQERYPENVPEAAQATLFQLFGEELARLQQGIPFAKLVLLNTNDPTYRAYVAAGLMRTDDEAFTHLESGMASVTVIDGFYNGQRGPVCYVLYHPDEAGAIYRNFVQPITAVSDERSAAAYLMGHEVGHCLDRLERQTLMAGKMVWNADEVTPLGLSPVAVQRVFGATLATAAYPTKTKDFYRDNAQRQFEERVADLFGVAWVWRLGGKEAVVKALEEARAPMHPWDSHATVPALQALDQAANKQQLSQAQSVADVWQLARKVQQEVGVDPSLGPGSEHALNPMGQYLDGTPAPSSSAAPAPQPMPLPIPQGRNFNDLPRFGAH